MRAGACVLLAALASASLPAQRSGKGTARELFYAEAGLIVAPGSARKNRFGGAKDAVVAVALGLKYRVWRVAGEQALVSDPGGPFQGGEQIRLTIETNDAGYLYIVHRQKSGPWRRLFPTPEIEGGNHFIRAGVSYPVPPEEGLTLEFADGAERLFLVLSREPVKELEILVSPRQPEGTVSAAPAPEVAEAVLEKIRKLLPGREIATEKDSLERAVYLVNRSGRADSLVAAEVRLGSR